jgi:photosystem II stability/assembly factor-like uncharacterized protein
MKLQENKGYLFYPAIAIVLFLLAGCVSGSRESVWETVSTFEIPHRFHVSAFLNGDFGITVGGDGETYYTKDGGGTWNRAEINTRCRFGLDIVDRNTALSGGNGGISITVDGGKTWSNIHPLRHDKISFIDENTGWIANNSCLNKT